MEPQIIQDDGEVVGVHNSDLRKSISRIDKSKIYKDLSTVIVCPTRGSFPTRVVQSWVKMQKPLSQMVYGPIFAEAMKVDAAYNTLVEYILGHEELSKCKYILTIEEDNLPPVDGLLKLYESTDEYDVVGGLYWSKGKEGFPMIFGNPEDGIMDVKAQIPKEGEVQRANALGMGFNLFKLDMFRHIEKPWFQTLEGIGENALPQKVTQDIYFYRKAAEKGYKFACDNRVLVGHYDSGENKIW